jgi:cytochrome c553
VGQGLSRAPGRVLAVATLALAATAFGADTPTPIAVPDTIAQRVQACGACHGLQGRPTAQGFFPRIAGKPAGYLYNQLDNFRAGRRNNAAMTYLVEHLSDDYLREIAGYFATLDLAYLPPQALTGVVPAVPGLLGLPRAYLVEQFGAWRTGQRKALAPDCMARIATALAPDDIGAVASWLASQPVPAPPAAAQSHPLPLACGSVPP